MKKILHTRNFFFIREIVMAIFLIQFFIQPVTAQSYCTTGLIYNSCSSYSAIDNFQLSNIIQTGTGCTGDAVVEDYTSLVCNLAQGETYYFAYTTNSDQYSATSDRLAIWVDLNDDYDFDDTLELIYSSATGGIKNGLITIAASANTGLHRMRVRSINNWSPMTGTDACTQFYNGETHDYTANITLPPACPEIDSLTVSNIGLHTANVSWGCAGCNGPFIIEYGLHGFTPDTGGTAGTGGTVLTLASLAASPVTLNGLNASSDYEVYVRRYCGVSGYSLNYGPVNFTTTWDVCSTLSNIACGSPVTATIPIGKGAIDTTCLGLVNTGKELLYSFTPTATGLYTLSILNTDNNYVSYLYKKASGGCNATGWSCASYFDWMTTFNSPQMTILDTLIADTTYYICIDAVNATNGAIHTFQIDCYTPYNPCDSVVAINCGVRQTAIIQPGVGVFNQLGYSNNFLDMGREKIYSFTPAITGIYSFTMDSVVGYYSTGLFFKAASEGCSGLNGWHFINNGVYQHTDLIGTLIAGKEYLFLVDAYALTGAEQYFRIDCYSPYDPCDSIETISCGSPVNFSVTAGAGSFLPTGCANNFSTVMMGKEKIFRFTAGTSGKSALHILSSPSSWNFTIKYYVKKASSGCDALGWSCFTILNTNDYQTFPFDLTADTAYYILADVGEIGGNSQTFEITCPNVWNPCDSIVPIACGDTTTANIHPGIGHYDFGNDGFTDYTLGKEIIYSFTATVSGTHAFKITATDYQGVYYYIKDASTGCNDTGWTKITSSAYPSFYQEYLPEPLIAGHTYYIMLDASNYGGATHSFTITCPTPFDPCASIIQISCGSIDTVVNNAGLGLFDPSYGSYYHYPGRETIFEFTPSITGNYLVEILSATGNYSIGYFIKDAGGGCNNNNWVLICNSYSAGRYGIPIVLTAGTSYYLLADSYTPGQTFAITCPQTLFNPCPTVTTIPVCDSLMTSNHSPGLGAFNPTGYDDSRPNTTPGRENIFAYTATQSGVYGIEVETGGLGGIGYFIKNAVLGCNNDGWEYIGPADSYGVLNKLPFSLTAGTTYYILADNLTTDSAWQTFKIVCPAPNPCDSIEIISACGWDHPTELTLPAGLGYYNLPSCHTGFPYTSYGRSKIFSFTPELSGNYTISTYSNAGWNGAFHFYVKRASEGCDGNNWLCIEWNYSFITNAIPFTLQADSTYYIMIASDYPWGVSPVFGFWLDCPSGVVLYADADGDGYGDPNSPTYNFMPVFGYVYDNNDCNDNNPSIYPGSSYVIGSTLNVGGCNSYFYHGQTYTASGTYTQTLQNAAGCDSVITLNVNIDSVNVSVTQSGNALHANETGATYQWLNCDSGYTWVGGGTNALFMATNNGHYAVLITKNGCTDTSNCYNITLVNIEDVALKNLVAVYPNPTTGGLAIQLDKPSAILNTEIYDVTGRLISSQHFKNTSETKLVLTGASGIYVVFVQTADYRTAFRVMKE